jgi:hypothetical protein
MIIPEGFAQATHIISSGFLPFGAVCTYGVDVRGVAGDPIDVAEDLYTSWQAFIMGNLHTSLNHVACRVKYGPNATGPAVDFTGEGVGGAGGEAAPPNLAYLIEKNTALGGRKGRGRMFLPGVVEGSVDGAGNVSSAVLADFAGNLGDWFAAILADNLVPVLLHSDLTAPTDIVNFTADPKCASQRQRMRR